VPRGAEERIVAKLRIGEDGGDPKAGGANLPKQRQGVAPLFLEPPCRRDPRARPRLGRQPRRREIQLGAEHPRVSARPERGGRRHLAIRDFAERAAVLARHADGSVPLLRKTRAVEDQHAFARRDAAPELPPQAVGRPRGGGDEVLKRLVVARFTHARQHGAHRFAGAVAQQTEQVPAKRAALRHMPERGFKRLEPGQQPIDPRRRIRREHRAAAYSTRPIGTMSSIQITPEIRRDPTI